MTNVFYQHNYITASAGWKGADVWGTKAAVLGNMHCAVFITALF